MKFECVLKIIYLIITGERFELDNKIEENKAAGPSTKNEEETDESVASGSSWEPSDDGALSGDSDSVCKLQYFTIFLSNNKISNYLSLV